MSTKGDFRSQWVQARINELRGEQRLGYAEIARRAGVSKQYLHQVANGGPPSEKLIDGLCKAFDFTPPAPEGATAVLDPVKSPTGDLPKGLILSMKEKIEAEEVVKEIARQGDALERLTRAVEDQSALLRTLTTLLTERSRKS